MQSWTEAELEFLREHLGLLTKEIYTQFTSKFGTTARSYDSVQKKIQKLREAFSVEADGGFDDITSPGFAVDELFKSGLPTEIPAETKTEYKEQQRFFLRDLVEFSKKYPAAPTPKLPVESNKSSLVISLSDLHFGQQNKDFNIDIAKERLKTLPARIFKQVRGKEIDEVVLTLIGDIVEGEDIFPTQAWHVVCPVITQVECAVESIWNAARTLVSLFRVPIRLVCVSGNHGRISKFASEKTNWDNIVYYCLSLLIKSNPECNISMECDYEEFRTFKVKDHLGMIHHQGVKHTGTPATREKIAGWAMSKKCDFIIHGHWHEWKVGGWQSVIVISNGSLCGPNDLSEKMAQETPARQGYFLVTPGEALTGFSYIEWPNLDTDNDSKISSDPKK